MSENQKETEPTPAGEWSQSDSLATPIGSVSTTNLPQASGDVKSQYVPSNNFSDLSSGKENYVPVSENQVLERAVETTAQGRVVARSTNVEGIIAELGDDVARMGDVLVNPDEIRQGEPTRVYVHHKEGKMRPSPTVIYEKGEGELSYYVIQAVADTKKRCL